MHGCPFPSVIVPVSIDDVLDFTVSCLLMLDPALNQVLSSFKVVDYMLFC